MIIFCSWRLKIVLKTFVFVHGAWHGAWCWERIASELRKTGHQVFTPDLPGHGSQYQPSHHVTFNDYVSSIISLILQQSNPVILVGHSMGGLVITAVAEKIPEHIEELVFITAYIPENGDSLASISEKSLSNQLSPYLDINKDKNEIKLRHSPALKKIFFNCCNKKDRDEAFSKLHSQPLEPFFAQIKVSEVFYQIPKRVFVCKNDKVLMMADQYRMAKTVVQDVITLDADHSAYYSAAKSLIQKLR